MILACIVLVCRLKVNTWNMQISFRCYTCTTHANMNKTFNVLLHVVKHNFHRNIASERRRVSNVNVFKPLHQPDCLICLNCFNSVMIRASKAQMIIDIFNTPVAIHGQPRMPVYTAGHVFKSQEREMQWSHDSRIDLILFCGGNSGET